MGNPTYLVILIGMFLVSFGMQKKWKLELFRNQKHLLVYFLTIFVVGVLWDTFSVSQHIWEFPIQGTIGIRIGLLPIEEYLFFLAAPYFGLVVFKCLDLVCDDNTPD